jgi:hypothetical protein
MGLLLQFATLETRDIDIADSEMRKKGFGLPHLVGL